MKNPNEIFFDFTFEYLLTQAGQRASLLAGGDGKSTQRVEGKISLADAEALGIEFKDGDLERRKYYVRTGDVEKYQNGKERTYAQKDNVYGDFVKARYDEPQTFESLLTDSLRFIEEQNQTIGRLKEEWATVERLYFENSPEIEARKNRNYNYPEIVWNDKVFEFSSNHLPVYQEFKRREQEKITARETAEREKKEQEAREKAEREAAKVQFIAAWVAEKGSDNQQERHAASLLPRDEVLEVIKIEAFAALSEFAEYEKITFGEVRGLCDERCACNYETCKIDCSAEDADAVSASEWDQIKAMKAILPDATFTLREHECLCDDDDCKTGTIERKGLYVKRVVGPFTFNKEFAVTES
jgi:hypothetical protein